MIDAAVKAAVAPPFLAIVVVVEPFPGNATVASFSLLFVLSQCSRDIVNRVWEKTPPPPKENAVICTVYNRIQ